MAKRRFTKYPSEYVRASNDGTDCHYVSKIMVDGVWRDIQEYSNNAYDSQKYAISDAQDALADGYKARVDLRKYYKDGRVIDVPNVVDVPYTPYFGD